MDRPELLELLYSAQSRYTAVRAVIRTRTHSKRSMRASRKSQGGEAAATYTPPAEPELPDVAETTTRAWLLADLSRWRLEQTARYGDDDLEWIIVRDRERSWTWSSYGGAFSNEDQPGSWHAPPLPTWLLDPSALLATEKLEPVGEARVAGRPAIEVRRESRPGPDYTRFHAPDGDTHDLYVDRERGIVLRAVGYVDGEPFQEVEMLEVAFDERFDEDVFRLEPPDGQPIKKPEELFAPLAPTTLDAAAREAPFTVLVPGRIPDDAEMRVVLIPAQPPVRPAAVHISYHRRDGRAWVSIGEQAEPDELLWGDDWETLEADGDKIFARSMSEQEQVGLEHDGTWVTIVGTGLTRDDLLEIARSLGPAPTDPPRLVDA